MSFGEASRRHLLAAARAGDAFGRAGAELCVDAHGLDHRRDRPRPRALRPPPARPGDPRRRHPALRRSKRRAHGPRPRAHAPPLGTAWATRAYRVLLDRLHSLRDARGLGLDPDDRDDLELLPDHRLLADCHLPPPLGLRERPHLRARDGGLPRRLLRARDGRRLAPGVGLRDRPARDLRGAPLSPGRDGHPPHRLRAHVLRDELLRLDAARKRGRAPDRAARSRPRGGRDADARPALRCRPRRPLRAARAPRARRDGRGLRRSADRRRRGGRGQGSVISTSSTGA